jgi:hypothetical protein
MTANEPRLDAAGQASMQQTAVDLGKPGYDMYYGYGMVNAVSAWKESSLPGSCY